jgi:hypothetical protein
MQCSAMDSSKDNKVIVYTMDDIQSHRSLGLDKPGLVLIALLAGGDYLVLT